MEKNICKECNQPFILTERDKYFYEDNGLSLPKRCWLCREKRKTSRRIDLRNHIGSYIARTKASIHGDRSYVGDNNKIKLLGVEEDGSILYEGKFYWEKGESQTLSADFNDGYWKVVEKTKQ